MSDQAAAAPKHPFSRFLGRKYGIIYADPPWPLTSKQASGKGGKGGKSWKRYKGDPTKPFVPYPVMSLQAIRDMPVLDLAAEHAHLFMWTFGRFVEAAYDTARAWGFDPKELIVWCKQPMGLGPGGAFVRTAEYLLYATKGRPKVANRCGSTWYMQKRGKHSAKPHFFRRLILDVCGDLPRIELFARPYTCAYDWDTWGNEMHPDDSAPA